jgi:cyanophycinase-like exopeptidase
MNTHGIIVLFGSGETLDTGRKIQRNVLFDLPRGQKVAIVETPAGFQPNSNIVAQELAQVFTFSLKEFVQDVAIIPARKKGTVQSPDAEEILMPLLDASYIVLGPGSPTYAAKQLTDSKALSHIKNRWEHGATLVLSSAAAIASGEYVLPVYEIYKAGADFYWEKGLNMFEQIGLPLSVLTHWNNTDGGEKLDTSHCFMGKERFTKLLHLFPKDKPLICIDEHTAVIMYIDKDSFQVRGKGNMSLLLEGNTTVFEHGAMYRLSDMAKGIKTDISTQPV